LLWLAFHQLGQGSHPQSQLSGPESARAARLQGRRREQYLAGRWLLRELCAMARGGRPSQWSLNAEGPPRAWHPRRPSPALSLSHSGTWVVAALARGPGVGVDLETWGQPRDWSALKRVLDRWGVAAGGSERPRAGGEASFLAAWTRYEACYKARAGGGRGRAVGWTLATSDWLCQTVGPPGDGLSWLVLGASALKGWRPPDGPWPASLPKAG
jgi:4'-phosphopantetheinyl transferase